MTARPDGLSHGAARKMLVEALRHHRLGRVFEAEALYRRVLAARPNDPDALFNLGNLTRDAGDLAAAEAFYRGAIAAVPAFAAAYSNLGNLLCRRGEADAAVTQLERAHALAPEDADILNNLAVALQAARDTDAAIERYRAALALQPDHVSALAGLGSLLAERYGEQEEAVRRLERALHLDPSLAEMRVNLANALGDLGRHREALSEWQRLVAERPNVSRFRVKLGHSLLALGRFADGRAELAEALRRDPDCAAALAAIAGQDRERLSAEDRRRIAAFLRRADLATDDRCRLEFALAKVLDAEADPDAAFTHLRRANESRRAVRAAAGHVFDLERTAARFDRLIACFDRALFRGTAGFGDPSDLPVFIVGMPRSGTTLVEQILASHPEVYGAGELPHMERIARTLPAALAAGSGRLYPECMAELTGETARHLAGEYLAPVRALSLKARRITDKAPFNFLHLGLIAVLLPGARIVHCVRDPLDTCFSCYEQDFRGPMPWSWDLGDLGRFCREQYRLMEHWRGALPLPILELRYERLVAETATVARELVRFCGLDWDPACLEFHRTERAVLTFSQAQVRQPIYATSVGKWRRYRRHLGPLIEALGDLAAVSD